MREEWKEGRNKGKIVKRSKEKYAEGRRYEQVGKQAKIMERMKGGKKRNTSRVK